MAGAIEGEGGGGGEVAPAGEPGGPGDERGGGGDVESGTGGADGWWSRGRGETGGEGAVADDAEGEFGLGGRPGGGRGALVPNDEVGAGESSESSIEAAAPEEAGIVLDQEGAEGVQGGFEGGAEAGGGFLEGGVVGGGGGEDIEMESGGAEAGGGLIVEEVMDALAQGGEREIDRFDWPPRHTLG